MVKMHVAAWATTYGVRVDRAELTKTSASIPALERLAAMLQSPKTLNSHTSPAIPHASPLVPGSLPAATAHAVPIAEMGVAAMQADWLD